MMEYSLNDLTEKQKQTLAKAFVRQRKNALKADNDSYIEQLVLTKYGKHWSCIIYQSVEDVVEGRWSLCISAIKAMIVDVVVAEAPECSNIKPLLVKLNENEFLINNGMEGDNDTD